jgi:hypothetical protein
MTHNLRRCFPSQVFEKFTKESSSLLDELVVINDSEKSSQLDKERYLFEKLVDICLFSLKVPND